MANSGLYKAQEMCHLVANETAEVTGIREVQFCTEGIMIMNFTGTFYIFILSCKTKSQTGDKIEVVCSCAARIVKWRLGSQYYQAIW
jgi:hypothetical protein